jgi:hypothetical protein
MESICVMEVNGWQKLLGLGLLSSSVGLSGFPDYQIMD